MLFMGVVLKAGLAVYNDKVNKEYSHIGNVKMICGMVYCCGFYTLNNVAPIPLKNKII